MVNRSLISALDNIFLYNHEMHDSVRKKLNYTIIDSFKISI